MKPETQLVSKKQQALNKQELSNELESQYSKVDTIVKFFANDGLGSRLDVCCDNAPVTDPLIYKDIVEKIPEVNSKINLFCRSTSQTSRRLVTPIMMNATNSPYRILRQMLAQIQDCKTKINGYLNNDKNITDQVKKELGLVVASTAKTEYMGIADKYQKAKAEQLKIFPYLESMLRELHSLIEAYYEIKKNKNIPDDWDEEDFEKEEVKANLGLAIRNSIKEFIQGGRINGSSLELFEAYGVSPMEAFAEISAFFASQKDTPYTYEEYNQFIDDTVDKYKDNHLQVLQRLGLNAHYVSKCTSKCAKLTDES